MTITSMYDIGDTVYFKRKTSFNNYVLAKGKIVNIIFTADTYTWWYVISSTRIERKYTITELYTRSQTEIAKTSQGLKEMMRYC